MYKNATTAKDANGFTIRVGDCIRYLKARRPRLVIVERIHKQGADGTILTCDGPPDAEYPHHYSCRASRCERMTLNR